MGGKAWYTSSIWRIIRRRPAPMPAHRQSATPRGERTTSPGRGSASRPGTPARTTRPWCWPLADRLPSPAGLFCSHHPAAIACADGRTGSRILAPQHYIGRFFLVHERVPEHPPPPTRARSSPAHRNNRHQTADRRLPAQVRRCHRPSLRGHPGNRFLRVRRV